MTTFFFLKENNVFFLSMFGTHGFHQPRCNEVVYRLPWSRVPRWGYWGHESPGKGHAHLVGSPVLPLCALMPPGKAHCFSTLGELPRLGALAALASQQVGRLASSRGIQASQVGSCCRIRVCSVIKTCKVVPSSPFKRGARGLPGAGITALAEVLFVLVWLFWPQAVVPLASLVGYCHFYPSQIRSLGKILVPVQGRWLKLH